MKRILMVDDVSTNLKCAAEVLKDQYEIMTAGSGEQAFEVLKASVPDLVLLDINMPGMSGFEVFDRMKMIPELSQIPVIFLTAATDKDIEVQGFEKGAADFIRKPYNPEDLIARISKVLQNSSSVTEAVLQSGDIAFLLYKVNPKKLMDWADSSNTCGYIILLNFENFEQIRELFGIEAENRLLARTVIFLEEIPGNDNCICHVDGNMFAVYVEGDHDADSVRAIIRRIIAGLEFEINESIPEEFDIKVVITAGIALKPEDGKNYKELLKCADKALYFARESGKRKYHFFNAGQGDQKEPDEESNFINLLQLKRQFEGKSMDSADGRESLQKTYHIISKYWGNMGKEMQIIFFDILGDGAGEEAMSILSEVIAGSLRKGDTAVKCGKLQYITVLLNASVPNGEIAAMRIKKKFEEKAGEKGISLAYEMRSI